MEGIAGIAKLTGKLPSQKIPGWGKVGWCYASEDGLGSRMDGARIRASRPGKELPSQLR